VCCDAFAEGGVAGASDGLETGDEIGLRLFDVKRVPGELSGGDVDARVEGKETALGVFIVGEFGLTQYTVSTQVRLGLDRLQRTNPSCATAGRARYSQAFLLQ
jgi:hypothetical protein